MFNVRIPNGSCFVSEDVPNACCKKSLAVKVGLCVLFLNEVDESGYIAIEEELDEAKVEVEVEVEDEEKFAIDSSGMRANDEGINDGSLASRCNGCRFGTREVGGCGDSATAMAER